MPKLTYKTLYCRLIYTSLKQILKTTKDAEIFINRAKVLEYYYKLYMLSKSIHMISHTPLTSTSRPFIEIYVDIIKYKPLSTNGHRYIVHLLDRYFNYQWIFFIRTKEAIFEKLIEILIFLKNQTSLKIQIIHLDNGTKFYLIKLAIFTAKKGIHLKPIVLRTSNQNGPIERIKKIIINQIYISFIINRLFK